MERILIIIIYVFCGEGVVTLFEHLGSSERLMSRSNRISGCEMYAIICALNLNDLNTKVDQLYRTVMNRSKFSASCIICSGYSLNKKNKIFKIVYVLFVRNEN